MLILKKKMAISVRFRLRPNRTSGIQQSIQVRITIDGKTDPGITTGHKCTRAQWDAEKQQVGGRSDEAVRINKLLTGIKNRILQIFDRQQERWEQGEGPKPTPDTVKFEYVKGERPPLDFTKEKEYTGPVIGGDVTLLSAFRLFVVEMKTKIPKPKRETLRAWQTGQAKLIQFLGKAGAGKRAVTVNMRWMDQYSNWLCTTEFINKRTGKGKVMQPQSASVYLGQVKKVMRYLVRNEVIRVNPLAEFEMPKSKQKEVYFLEPEHIDRLFALKSDSDPEREAVWWLKLICLTGLDYPDAQRYVRDRAEYEQTRHGKKKIIIKRDKPPHNECTIPYLPELDTLFAEYPAGAFASTGINKTLREMQHKIGFKKPLTCKIGRKTAGAWFLWRGYRLEAVSKILGHSSIVTTQKYYVKITETLIDQEMERLGA